MILVEVIDPAFNRLRGWFEWTASVDALVRFVYANQNGLFSEDAQVFDLDGVPHRRLYVMTGHDHPDHKIYRVFGSWEKQSVIQGDK